MIFTIDNRSGRDFPDNLEKIMKEAVHASLLYEDFPLQGEVSVSIVDNAEIREINKDHRRIDSATDVLSFPMLDYGRGEKPPLEDPYLLGDIVLSVEKAMAQAEEYGHSLEREVGFLTVHSMLHLMGYDHMSPEEEAVMCAKQEEILKGMNLSR